MTILKVMFAVALGTYVAYELTFNKNKKDGSSGGGKGKLEPAYERVPV